MNGKPQARLHSCPICNPSSVTTTPSPSVSMRFFSVSISKPHQRRAGDQLNLEGITARIHYQHIQG
jgi:hypothetical protein